MSQTAARTPPAAPIPASAAEDAAPLDQRIDELLGEISDASRSVDDMLREADGAAPPVETAAEAAAEARPVPEAIASAPLSPELEASIDEVIEQTRQSLEEPLAPVTGTVGEIDEALAKNADAMMSEATPAAIGSAESELEVPEHAEVAPDPIAAEAVAAIDPASGETLGQTASGPVVPVVVSAPPEPLEPLDAAAAAGAALAPRIDADLDKLPPGSGRLLPVLRAASWPMSRVPLVVRDLIGWLALVTLFNSACLWLYLLL